MKFTFNNVAEHFRDARNIECPDRLHVRYKRTGIDYPCYYPNNYWAERNRIYLERFKNPEFKMHKTFNLFTRLEDRESDDPSMYVVCSINSSLFTFHVTIYGIHGMLSQINLWPRSNREISEESVMDLAWKYADTIIFRAGRFREMQRLFGLSKRQCLDAYRLNITDREPLPVEEKDVKGAIRRKYNVEIVDLDPSEYLKTALKARSERPNEKLVLRPAPDMSYVLGMTDGDVDEIERLFYEEWPEYEKGTILV